MGCARRCGQRAPPRPRRGGGEEFDAGADAGGSQDRSSRPSPPPVLQVDGAEFVIDVALLKRQFGENDAEFFLQLLSATRRQFKDYFYPTEENPAELHPLLFAESDE